MASSNYRYLTLILMFFPLILFGQSKVAFLFEKLKTSPDNPALLNELSEAMLENSATAADSLAMLALKHAKHKGLRNEEIRAIVNIYNSAWETSDYKKVIRFAEMATTLYLSVGKTVEAAGALNEAALASYEIDQYDHALRNYKRSINILLKAGDNKNLPSVLTNMAQVYERKGEFDSAVYYLTKSIGMSHLPGFEPELSAAYGNLGYVYKSMGNYSKALENYSAAYKISVAMEETAYEIKKKLPKVYSKDLIEILFRLPYTKRQHLIDENIGNLKTVGNYLIALEENGFLKSEKVGKEKLYLNQKLLEILEKKE